MLNGFNEQPFTGEDRGDISNHISTFRFSPEPRSIGGWPTGMYGSRPVDREV